MGGYGMAGQRTPPVPSGQTSFIDLVPFREAATHIAALGLTISKASDMYGASEQLIRMRLNVTGASQRVANRRRYA
jgi:hypothetical protein